MTVSRRVAAVSLVTCLALGCAHLQTDTHVEKGAVLRTFDREQVQTNAGIQAQVEPHWPDLSLSFSAFDLCRREKVQESLEDQITEVSSPTAGPAIATGASATLIGAGLFLARGLFPNKPDPHVIDASGQYGLSGRQIATGWSIGLMIGGVPALAEGLVQLVQTGDRTDSRKVETVLSSVELPCHVRPVNGQLEFPGGASPPPPVSVTDGRLRLKESFIRRVDLSGFTLSGQPVVVDDEDMGRLDSFRACLELTPVTADALAGLSLDSLQHRVDRARACQSLPNAPGADTTAALEREVRKRKPAPPPPSARQALRNFDEALAAYPPSQSFGADSADLPKLADTDALAGQAVLLRGIVGPHVDPETIQLDVGAQHLWILLELSAPWLADMQEGSRVELLGVVMGRESKGPVAAPLLRGIWARSAL